MIFIAIVISLYRCNKVEEENGHRLVTNKNYSLLLIRIIIETEAAKTSSGNVIVSLKSALDDFYKTNEIEVPTYDERQIEIRRASRRADEFGFEIIDWAFLFLHFEQMNLLDNFDEVVIGSLNFVTSGDKYDDQNREQGIKLKLYIKSLLLAFHAIKSKKIQYDLDTLPTKFTIEKLEKWIKRYAITYSTENIPNKKIDVFNDMYSSFGYNIYHQ